MASDAVPYGSSPLRICLSKQKLHGESIPIEKRALSEITGAQNVPTQHHDAVFTGFGGSAKLCEGEGSVDLLTHHR